MASKAARLQTYLKISGSLLFPSIIRFTEHVQLKGGHPRKIGAYMMMLRLPARWAGQASGGAGEGTSADSCQENPPEAFPTDGPASSPH